MPDDPRHRRRVASLIALLHLPDMDVETAAAELLAKLAQVGEYQHQISPETIPLLIELLHSSSPSAQVAGLHALNELLFENRANQIVALRAGAVPPCVELARQEHDSNINSNAATLLCQMVLAEAADEGKAEKRGKDEKGLLKQGSVRLGVELRLNMLAAMAMSANAEAHSVAAMGLATMTNASDANLPMIARLHCSRSSSLARHPRATRRRRASTPWPSSPSTRTRRSISCVSARFVCCSTAQARPERAMPTSALSR